MTVAGCSTVARCAAPGSTSRRAPGMPSASACWCSGGVAGSSAPPMTSVGAVMAGELGAQVHVLDDLAARGVALGGLCSASIARSAATNAGVGRGEPPAEPARQRRRRRSPPCPARGRSPRGRPSAPAAQCADVQQSDQPVDPLGRVGGEPHAGHPAERQAGRSDARSTPELVEQGEHVARRGPRCGTGRAGPASAPCPRGS